MPGALPACPRSQAGPCSHSSAGPLCWNEARSSSLAFALLPKHAIRRGIKAARMLPSLPCPVFISSDAPSLTPRGRSAEVRRGRRGLSAEKPLIHVLGP